MKKEFESAEQLKEKAKVLLENLLQTQKALTKITWRHWIPFEFLKPKLPLDRFHDFLQKQAQMASELLKICKESARKGPKAERSFALALVSWVEALLPCYETLLALIEAKKVRLVSPKEMGLRALNEIFMRHEEQMKSLFAKAPALQESYQKVVASKKGAES